MFIRFTEYMNMKSDNVMSVLTCDLKRSHAYSKYECSTNNNHTVWAVKKNVQKYGTQKNSFCTQNKSLEALSNTELCTWQYVRRLKCSECVFRFTLWLTLSILIKQTKKNSFFNRVLCSHCTTRGLKFIHFLPPLFWDFTLLLFFLFDF